DEEAHLLSIGLVGMAETSARYWLNNHGSVPKDAAEQLVARLAWRGISGWDLQRREDENSAPQEPWPVFPAPHPRNLSPLPGVFRPFPRRRIFPYYFLNITHGNPKNNSIKSNHPRRSETRGSIPLRRVSPG